MSSSQRPERVVHQDYIARIRYSNALPPPPHPPKLLDIPGTGLASGQYTSAGYASRLAREQPLNIEADAELGMPIDLVGIPGIFDGDERAIHARPGAKIHPADRDLLKPLAQLGKANAAVGGVSFLRRTEYTAAQGPQHMISNTSKDMMRLRNDPKRRKLNAANVDKEDPMNILRNIVKGFDIAYPADAYKGADSMESIRGAAVTDNELRAWTHPKHPTKPDLKLLDSYPVLPDLDALMPIGAYMVMKFQTNPLASEDYDPRLDTAILRPVDDPIRSRDFQRRMQEWEAARKLGGTDKARPMNEYDYEYYAPSDPSAVKNIKRKFDVLDPDNEDEALYTDVFVPPASEDGAEVGCFKYDRIRVYETYNQHGHPENFYNDSVALALHDEDDVSVVPGGKRRLGKGAYYYPVIQRTALRAKRKFMDQPPGYENQEEVVDQIDLRVSERDEQEMAQVMDLIGRFDPTRRTGGVNGAAGEGGEGGEE